MKATLAVTLALGALSTTSALAQLPAGWTVKTDRDAPVANVKFVPMGSGFHITMGPAAILYNAATGTVGEKFHTVVSFTQTKAPTHAEGYGIFFAGKNLDGATQSYTYFLIRGDGTYLVKKRTGAETAGVVDWTPNPAVNKADADGKATNKIEINSAGDKIEFIVNGKSVHSMPKADHNPSGIVGLRVNHNLDVHVEGFAVHKL